MWCKAESIFVRKRHDQLSQNHMFFPSRYYFLYIHPCLHLFQYLLSSFSQALEELDLLRKQVSHAPGPLAHSSPRRTTGKGHSPAWSKWLGVDLYSSGVKGHHFWFFRFLVLG